MSTYTPVASQTLSASASSVTFSNIPQDYTDLILVCSNVKFTNSGEAGRIQFNADTGSNYSNTVVGGDGSTAQSSRQSSVTSGRVMGAFVGPSTTQPETTIIQLNNYSNSTTYKTYLSRFNGAGTEVDAMVGLWRSTAAINQVTLITTAGSFTSGSTFSLYGIQAGTPKAQGGQIVTTDGTYWYHTFTSSGTFTTTSAITADYLVLAGGGGAGTAAPEQSGGGGAGGLRSSVSPTGGGGSAESAISLTANNVYSIIVGGGGALGASGNNSSISGSGLTTITSTGGGYGSGRGVAGGSGGSGGGGGDYGGAGGSASPSGQGYAGGAGSGDPAGSGGGAGGAGTTGFTRGASVSNSISGTSVAYGQGGAGGGAGSNGSASSANIGKGGDSGETTSYAGGSGVVVIRYAV